MRVPGLLASVLHAASSLRAVLSELLLHAAQQLRVGGISIYIGFHNALVIWCLGRPPPLKIKMLWRAILAGAIACRAAKPTTLQVATYNVLNPVHKSVGNNREADDDALWLARGRRQAAFVADALGAADVICLQEWFFEQRWSQLFEEALPSHKLCTARRRGVHPHDGSERRDGLAIFSRLPLVASEAVAAPSFDDGRSGLIATLKRGDRPVVVATCHLPFADAAARQAQASACAAAAERQARRDHASLTVLCGDFNENAAAPACRGLEARGWTNCAAAAATQALDSGTGGTTFLGTTHLAHTGDALSCDHIFATDRTEGGQRSSGCFDAAGARLVAARRVADAWDPDFVDSDHTPVVAEFSFRAAKAPADTEVKADPFLPPWPDCIA